MNLTWVRLGWVTHCGVFFFSYTIHCWGPFYKHVNSNFANGGIRINHFPGNSGYHMMTSSNGNIFRVTGPLCRQFTGHRLSKQSWGWWFETLSRPLWRHRNEQTYAEAIMATTLSPNRQWNQQRWQWLLIWRNVWLTLPCTPENVACVFFN